MFDSFRTIAEVSVTLAGFVGIIAVLRRRDEGFSRFGLVQLLQTTFAALFFALLPDLLSNVFSMDTTWRASAGAFGLYHGFAIVNHRIRQRGLRKTTWLQIAITIASIPVVVLKLLVGLGFLMQHAYAIYYLGLLWLLGIAVFLFGMLLFDPADLPEGDPEAL